MTDTERERIKAICEVAGVSEIDDLSDGFHTFRQLYYQRMMLFAAIVKQNRDKAWKSLRHEDGDLCFGGGWFIVGIDTPEGSYTYHYESNFYSLFECEELERGKHWDGHTEKDVTRLLSLPTQSTIGQLSTDPQSTKTQQVTGKLDSDCISRQAAVTEIAKFMLEYGGENEKRERDALHRAAKGIKALQSAQPEIIRCKDCKWWDRYNDIKGYCMAAKSCTYTSHWDIQIRRTYDGDFYCAHAEPKEEYEEGQDE